MTRYVGRMQTGGAREAVSVPAAALAALATAPLWTAALPTVALIVAAVLIVLATAAVADAGLSVPGAPPSPTPGELPAGTARRLLTQFAAGVRGSRAPPLASA